jgi:simple sugar transport system substrate-binding protein
MKLATYMLAFGMLGIAGAAQAADTLTIGAIYLDAQGFYAGVRKGVQVEGAKQGKDLSIIETNAQGDVSKESSFIDTLVSARVSAIILSAVSADGSVAAIRRASKAGIPVVCYNTCINPDDMKKYVAAYAVGDPFTFGEKIGGVAADYFAKAGNTAPKIGVLNCEFVEVCVQRRKGFEKAMGEKVPGYKIVSNQEGTILDKAISVGQNILSANPDVDAFFGESGGATLGAVKAVRNQGHVGKTVVFCCDMTTDIAQELIDNAVLKGEVDVSGQGIGTVALDAAVDAIKGKKPDGIVVPVPIDLYTAPAQAKAWLEAHQDGLP